MFPAARTRKPRPQRYGVAWWMEQDGHVWLVRRPGSGLLGGMAALPGGEWAEASPAPRDRLGSIRHVFTHFSLDLAVELRSEPMEEGWWQPIDRLQDAGLPTLYRRAAELALKCRKDSRAAA
jgi:A/G-specific adenine glycosylase